MEYPKLKAGHKKAWLKALRSGEYYQGRKALLSDRGGYWVRRTHGAWGVDGDFSTGKVVTSRLETWFTSESIRDSQCTPNSIQGALITMNDTYCKSFTEIADWIEVNL